MTDLHTAAREALKPCPFCGGAAEFERMGTPRQSCIVACGNCGARHESSDEGANCGQSWNARAALDAGQAQPVAYMYDQAQWNEGDLRGRGWYPKITRHLEGTENMRRNVVPLYAAPQASQPVALDLREAYALACDLVCWINADETVMGDRARTYDTAVKLRDCLGKMPVGAQPVAPAGWKLVPVEVTLDMLSATMRECGGIGAGSCGEHAGIDYDDLRSVWAEMLSAAPPAPAAQPLTADQVFQSDEIMAINAGLGLRIEQLMDLVRAIERAHGIGAQP